MKSSLLAALFGLLLTVLALNWLFGEVGSDPPKDDRPSIEEARCGGRGGLFRGGFFQRFRGARGGCARCG